VNPAMGEAHVAPAAATRMSDFATAQGY
jgi:hypothetical protein